MPFVLFPRIFQHLHVNDTHLLQIFLHWLGWLLLFLAYFSAADGCVSCLIAVSLGLAMCLVSARPYMSPWLLLAVLYVFAMFFSFQCFIALSLTFSCVQLCSS